MTKTEKETIVDAICGCGLRSIDFAVKMEKRGLAEFTGNQWNEDWTFYRGKLLELEPGELEAIYREAKE